MRLGWPEHSMWVTTIGRRYTAHCWKRSQIQSKGECVVVFFLFSFSKLTFHQPWEFAVPENLEGTKKNQSMMLGIPSLGYGRRPFLVELGSVGAILIICQLPGKPARTGWWWFVTPPLPATPTWKPLKGYEMNTMGTRIKGKIARGFGSFLASLLLLMCGWKTPDLIPTNLILILDAYLNVRNKGLGGVFKTSIFLA